MEKEFVPFNLAVKLKELGFKRTCLAEYIDGIFYLSTSLNNKKQVLTTASAPLWQQAFDFLLKKYNLYGIIIPTITMHWTFKTMTVVEGVVEVPPYNHVDGNDYHSVENARKACLEKLIEIVENEKIQN